MPDSLVQQLNDVGSGMPDQLAPQSDLQVQIKRNPGLVRNFISQLFGIKDAMRAARGDMTEDEAQNFALTAALGIIPMAGEAGPAVRAVEEVAPEAAQSITQMIRAYHGSPYDFDKFDLSKIGTGEGAQSYGRGLYFAENPGVAGSYKKALSDSTEPVQEGNFWKVRYYDRASGEWAERDFKTKDEANAFATPGRMYEVNINADPEHFLDWHKPLSEQPQNVKDIFAASGIHSSYAGPMGTRIESNAPLGELTKGKLQQNDSILMQNLRQAGIPGIKYLDQGSRITAQEVTDLRNEVARYERVLNEKPTRATAPLHELYKEQLKSAKEELAAAEAGMQKPTHNYVVFDDKLVDIIKKYGLAGLIAGGVSNFMPKQK